MNRKLHVSTIIFLLISLSASIFLRVQNLPLLEGKYPLDNDSVRFLRQAKIIVQDGSLPNRDMMRWLPFGRDMDKQLSLSSYAIAYLYKFLRIFTPSITIERAAIYYPIICFSLSLLVFFALMDRLFDRYTALISTAIFAVFPSLIPRSMAGFSDRDSFVMLLSFLTFYLFIRSLQTQRQHYRLGFAFSSGFIMMLLGLTWEGSGLFIAVVALFHLAKLMTGSYKRDDFYAYLIWYAPVIFGLLTFTRTYRSFAPFAILAWGAPSFVLLVSLLHFGLSRWQKAISLITLKLRLPFGFSVFLLAILACLLIVATAFVLQPTLTAQKLIALKDNFLAPLGQSRLMRSVAELQRPLSVDWASRYGIFFFLFSAGALLSMRKLALSLKFNPWISMASLEILLTGVFFSRFSLRLPLSGESALSAATYFGSILFFLFVMLGLYFYSQRNLAIEEWRDRKITEDMLFLLLWFTLILFTARGAERYNLFFAPTAIAFGGYALFQLFLLAQKKIIHRIKRVLSYAFIVVFVALGLSNYFRVSYSIAKTAQPFISQSWIQALDWMRDNLPADAVVASWWDYGSWINTLAEKATIVDEDHYVPYWIYLMARHVMLGQTEMEALEFLKSHGVTHLMISTDEIASLPVISTLGSDENFDRRSFIPGFVSQNEVIQPTDGVNIFRYSVPGGRVNIDDVLRLNGKMYPKGGWRVGNIYLKVEGDGQKSWKLKGAILEVQIEGKTIKLPPRELYFKGKLMRPKGEALPGAVVVYSKDNSPLKWRVLFLSQTVRNALMVRLQLLNENSNFFIPIYPPANQQGKSQLNNYSVRVWKINYPEDIKSNPKYLETEFSEPKLYRSWVQGRK